MPVLSHGGRRVIEWIAAWIIVHAILPHKRINGQQRARGERVLITERIALRPGLLALILRELIVRVRNLEPVACAEQIQMKRILAAGLIIDAVENRLAVSDVVKRLKFGTVQK